MEIRSYVSGLMLSNMFIVTENGHAIVIDPFDDVSKAQDLTIDYIILTHEHYDHISGVNAWRDAAHSPVLCSNACAERLVSPKKNMSKYFSQFCEIQTMIKLDVLPPLDMDYICSADETFEDSLELQWQGHIIELMEIPGHSLGSIGIMIDNEHFFSGDSLLENYETELRLPGGSPEKWEEIGRKRITTLQDGITVYPGHFGSFILRRTG